MEALIRSRGHMERLIAALPDKESRTHGGARVPPRMQGAKQGVR